MRIARVLLMLALLVGAFLAGLGYQRWYAKPDSGASAKKERRILYYHDPMHPAYKSDKPGIAPDCGMRLEPVYADDAAASPAPTTLPPGSIEITPARQQLIGVRYGEARYASGSRSIRATGRVMIDETRVTRVQSRVDGWIEQVFVAVTGDTVRKGQPMLTLYSPELLASQREYLLALKAKGTMRHSMVPGASDDSDSLVDAARRRLGHWSLSPAEIAEVESTGQPLKSITLYAPAAGFITTRNAFPSQRIAPETELYTITDLSRIWIVADVFEFEGPALNVGQMATVTMPYEARKRLRGRVSFIFPQVDPATRTLKIRIEADNPDMALKPDMYVDVDLSTAMAQRLVVPAEAVLDSGLRKTVFVDLGNGYLEPRAVETGERMGDQIEIRAGLKAGERIVVSGNFLVDSESQLKAAAAGMGAGPTGVTPPDAAPAPAKTPAGGHRHD